jgi:kynurenine formamidase
MLIPISYPLTIKTPLYPDTPPLTIKPHRSINGGDSANTSVISLSNHSGTHVDMPLHFCRDGLSVSEILTYPNTFFPAYCIDIQKKNKEEISTDDFFQFLPHVKSAKALLIRTGMYRSRGSKEYLSEYPFINPEVPDFLRAHLPSLTLFGIDTLSISNPSKREWGRECHRNFLCKMPNIFLMEDVDLSYMSLTNTEWILHVYPWIHEALDAVPVVALLEK